MSQRPASASTPPGLPPRPCVVAPDADEVGLAAVRRRLAEGCYRRTYRRTEVLENLAEALGAELSPPP